MDITLLAHTLITMPKRKMPPKAIGHKAPEKHQKAITPIDNHHMAPTVYAADDVAGHHFRLHLHGKARTGNERSVNKTRTDVSKPNGESLGISQLLQSLDIGILKGFGRTVGRRRSKSFHTSYRRDNGNMPSPMRFHILKDNIDKPAKSHRIGIDGIHLYLRLQIKVLRADTSRMEVQVDTTKAVYKCQKTVRRIRHGDIAQRIVNTVISHIAKRDKRLFSTRHKPHLPSITDKTACHFTANTR